MSIHWKSFLFASLMLIMGCVSGFAQTPTPAPQSPAIPVKPDATVTIAHSAERDLDTVHINFINAVEKPQIEQLKTQIQNTLKPSGFETETVQIGSVSANKNNPLLRVSFSLNAKGIIDPAKGTFAHGEICKALVGLKRLVVLYNTPGVVYRGPTEIDNEGVSMRSNLSNRTFYIELKTADPSKIDIPLLKPPAPPRQEAAPAAPQTPVTLILTVTLALAVIGFFLVYFLMQRKQASS